jgi:hypothetical protein
MRRFCGGLVAKRNRGPVAPGAALVAAGLLAVAAAPAGATVTPTTSGSAVLVAMATGALANPSLPASFPVLPPRANPPQTAPTAFPVATSTSAIAPFPLTSPYVVLSSGDARASDQPTAVPSADDGADPTVVGRGDSAYDATIFSLARISVPAGQTCLSFDFRFLSAEYPSRVGSRFNDAFVAELVPNGDPPTWTTSGGNVQNLQDDFAVDSQSRPLTINSAGPTSMSPVEAAGTPYGGATAPLRAQIPVVSSQNVTYQLYLSIFDQSDGNGDTAVFIDNLTYSARTGAACERGVAPLGPAPVITGPTVAATVATPTPTLTGTAGNAPGDATTVTVRIYNGAMAAGTPVQTRSAPRTGTTWAVATDPLAPGQYTAQATQVNAQGFNGVSAPTTFTVIQPAAAAQLGGGSSQQQTPGDRDNDGIPDDQDTSDGSLPPIPGKTFDARVVSGDVFIKYPAGAGPRAAIKPPKGFVALEGAANVPMGAQLDTRRGRVAVTSAADTGASKTQTADFYDGIFQVKQATPKKKPKKATALITDLVLKGEPPRSECAPLKGSASAAAAKKKKRGAKSVLGSLWGNGKGKFRTNGKYSSATVRGTIWLTQDRCDGTLTTVRRGTVSVRDLKRRRTVTVKAGHSYLARAASRAKGATK